MNHPSSRPVHGGNLAWAATLAGCSPSLILDFSASINPLGPPASAIAAIHAHLAQLRDYPDPNYRSLREAIAQFHHLSSHWVLPGNGSAELLTWASRELAELEAVYLLTPAFGDYFRALKAFDATIRPLSFPFSSQDPLAKHSEGFPKPQAPSGFLLNNPHNPTGRLFSVQEVLPLLEAYSLVVLDEAFMDFLPPQEQESLIDRIADYPNLVILRSLTKFYTLPGLRLGYAIAHPDRLNRWQQWRDPWSINTLAAAAAEAVFQDHEFQHNTWDWLPSVRSRLFDQLSQIPGLLPFPSAANFLLVQTDRSAVDLQAELLKRDRILIRDCLSFPELGDRFFRIAIRTEAENDRLVRGLIALLS